MSLHIGLSFFLIDLFLYFKRLVLLLNIFYAGWLHTIVKCKDIKIKLSYFYSPPLSYHLLFTAMQTMYVCTYCVSLGLIPHEKSSSIYRHMALKLLYFFLYINEMLLIDDERYIQN